MSKEDPSPTIVFAPTDQMDDLGDEVDRVLEALGHPEAFVTDESSVHDFLMWGEEPHVHERNQTRLDRMSAALGVPIETHDLLIAVAQRMRAIQRPN